MLVCADLVVRVRAQLVVYVPELPPNAVSTHFESRFRLDLVRMSRTREAGRFTVNL